MAKTDFSLIITVLNEAGTIHSLLKAVNNQALLPNEIVVVDGGSIDKTPQIIKKFTQDNPDLNLKIFIKPGFNISQGRNFAINQAKNELIAITDAGCVPDKNWLEELVKTYQQEKSDQATSTPVVAGYYYGLAKTPFEQAVVPYVLVMPDRINPDHFLSASRSMLLEKKVWQQIGGFREDLTVSEDFAFAQELIKNKVPLAFNQQAKVGWMPRKNLKQFAQMIFKFAQNDIKAGIFRPKVGLIFGRYLINLAILAWLWPNFEKIVIYLLVGISLYSWWAINKNKKYVPDGWCWLPVLQIVSDLAVMGGTIWGLFTQLI